MSFGTEGLCSHLCHILRIMLSVAATAYNTVAPYGTLSSVAIVTSIGVEEIIVILCIKGVRFSHCVVILLRCGVSFSVVTVGDALPSVVVGGRCLRSRFLRLSNSDPCVIVVPNMKVMLKDTFVALNVVSGMRFDDVVVDDLVMWC